MTTSPVTEPSFAPGEILAEKYRVDRVLGSGGMAVVLAATHVRLHEPVAIKILHRQVLARPGALDRFLREARVAMRLRSEHVARVFDVATMGDGTPFIVMELLRGADLAAVLLERGPLSVTEVVDYVLQVCQALAEAHAAGIVHRDLKPANLFLTTGVDGAPCVKVLDFGVSKLLLDDSADPLAMTARASSAMPAAGPALAASAGPSSESPPSSVTLTRALLGSPLYMAPEQIQSARDVDARADVWALGVIVYELVSGQLPFPGETLSELCAQIIAAPVAPLVGPSGPLPELHAASRRASRRTAPRDTPTCGRSRPRSSRSDRPTGARASSASSESRTRAATAPAADHDRYRRPRPARRRRPRRARRRGVGSGRSRCSRRGSS